MFQTGKNSILSELTLNDPLVSENTLVIKLGYHTINLKKSSRSGF